MDNSMDFVTFYSYNALELRMISLFLQWIITERLFYYGKTDQRNERKNTRRCH